MLVDYRAALWKRVVEFAFTPILAHGTYVGRLSTLGWERTYAVQLKCLTALRLVDYRVALLKRVVSFMFTIILAHGTYVGRLSTIGRERTFDTYAVQLKCHNSMSILNLSWSPETIEIMEALMFGLRYVMFRINSPTSKFRVDGRTYVGRLEDTFLSSLFGRGVGTYVDTLLTD